MSLFSGEVEIQFSGSEEFHGAGLLKSSVEPSAIEALMVNPREWDITRTVAPHGTRTVHTATWSVQSQLSTSSMASLARVRKSSSIDILCTEGTLLRNTRGTLHFEAR